MLFDTPVVFIFYNRSRTTQQVFAEIARAKPRRLLLIADGPRRDRLGDAQRVAATREIVDRVDWPCDVRRNFSDANLGCQKRISSGLTWAFEQVEEAIVLEDDCLPDPTFFPFCSELLKRYRTDARIMAISGNNFQQGQSRTPNSYYFSKHPHCWGWATWRRAWQKFDVSMQTWPEFRASGGLHAVVDSQAEERYWTRIFEDQYHGRIDSWGYPWLYTCWSQHGLAILPDVNLVSNIGFGAEASHTTETQSRLANLPTGQITRLSHPPYVVRHKQADQYTFSNVFQPSLSGRLRMWTAGLYKRLRETRAGEGSQPKQNSDLSTEPPQAERRCA